MRFTVRCPQFCAHHTRSGRDLAQVNLSNILVDKTAAMEMETENTPTQTGTSQTPENTSESKSKAALNERLQQISTIGLQLAVDYQHQTDELLAILRTLEELHRHIREDFFQPALPQSRHSLYSLLMEIESQGGWPYIERMRLQDLLQAMVADTPDEVESSAP
jgi:fido (protein-threonine AMPylation protein)